MSTSFVPPGTTLDSIWRNELQLAQPCNGYRFSVDSLLLVDFVAKGSLGRVTDLGAGVGVIGLALACRDPQAEVHLVEVQSRLATLCRWNVMHNRLAHRVQVVEGDVREEALLHRIGAASQEWVVSCPPYFKVGTGDISPHEELAIARYETKLPLEAWVAVAARLLKPRGRLGVVYPADRAVELMTALVHEQLYPARMRWVHPASGAGAQRVLVEAIKQATPTLRVEAPLFVRNAQGEYTDEVRLACG